MTVEQLIDVRHINRVMHFTTTQGLLGIVASWAVKSRARLPKEKYLEYVYQPNALVRKDVLWLDFVNLSIERINGYFFNICANRWHTDKQWCVLSFRPEILTHCGVYFATTNNMYSDVKRGRGISGLQELYSPEVASAGKPIRRTSRRNSSEPTCLQAEVLYPGELSLDYLDAIYLSSDEQTDDIEGQLAVFDRPKVRYSVDLSIFEDSE